MTNEEAINLLDNLLGMIEDSQDNDYDTALKMAIEALKQIRCKDCKHRVVNEHYGEKGYFKLKAYCDLDTGDIFELGRHAEEDDWFCADAERRKQWIK